MDEVFEYRFTKLDPVSGDHIDPPSTVIYETLLNKGPDGAPLPGLATAWSVSGDGLKWRLELREGARFHSGDPCDGLAVAAALERCRWGDGLTRQVWYWDPVDAVVVLDDRTVEFRLHYPCARLPVLLWGAHTAIFNVRRCHDIGALFGIVDADGTGSHRLTAFSDVEVVAERSEMPGVAPLPSLHAPRTIRWRSVTGEAQRQMVLCEGGADIVRAVSSLPASADGGALWHYHEQPENSQFYLAFNFDDPRGFGELDFRRAVDAFIDRPALVEAAFAGRGDGRRSPIPLGDEYADAYDPDVTQAMCVAEAEHLLDRMGYICGAEGIREREGRPLRIDCVTQDAEPFRRLATALAHQLARAGIVLEFRFLEPFEKFYRACEGRPASFLSKWLWPDAVEAVMGFSRSNCIAHGGGNWQGARLPAVDACFDQFLQATSPTALEEAARAVQEVFMRELPYLPLCSPMESYAVRRNVDGFHLVPRTLYPSYGRIQLRQPQSSTKTAEDRLRRPAEDSPEQR